jgi:peroxiredoxin
MAQATAKKAPPFKARSSAGREVSLDDYKGKYVVLYFYPKSFTGGCTIETIGFANATDERRALGALLVGVRADSEETQCKFAEKHGATFPILADTDRSICKAYGVLYPLLSRGMRVTFIIDPQGFIVARFHHELLFKKHIQDSIAFLQSQR